MKRTVLTLLQQRFFFTGIGILLGILAILTPFFDLAQPVSHIGGLLIWAAMLEIFHGFRRVENLSRHSAWFSGAITMIIGVLMVNAAMFQRGSLIDIILFLFAVDIFRYSMGFIKDWRNHRINWSTITSGVGNIVVAFLIISHRGKGLEWVVAVCGSLRILGTVYQMFVAKTGNAERAGEDVVQSLGIKGSPELDALAERLAKESNQRAPIDAGWIMSFVIVLFFIHLGRMGLDRSALGIISPLVAAIGDIFVGLVVAFVFIAPLRNVFRKVTALILPPLWRWVEKVPEDQRKFFHFRTLAKAWVTRELRISISIRKSGYSLRTAFRNGLKIGLPAAALLVAIMPVLGMSWYFDTENWASGIWDNYAGSRTEVWREAMINASGEKIGSDAFRLRPKGVSDGEDFSFVVIGDPGEGDPSQHVLKDQILAVSNKPDISFVVISSDIVYPSGAMRDYERKFFLPFKGLTKPVYAIPGNHDWYDALDGFAATFFTPDAARHAIRARVESDLKLSSTTDEVIETIIDQAAFLRKEYQLPTGHQTAPFFQVSNDRFVFISIDTGVGRRVDSMQLAWIKSVLEASRGKYVMALLGHPFYAIGEYQGDMNPDFSALHSLLRKYGVSIIMAGDTHDMEYYQEKPQTKEDDIIHHFVNGGGGAYLSIGAAMASPDSRPTKDWAIYPSRGPLMSKIDSLTPNWKYPAWVWLKKYNGYPFSAEWLSAAFDYNQAPYFQSFMEIKVEASRRQVRLIPYGIHGQLRWSDFEYGGIGKPSWAANSDLAQWILPMKNSRK